MLKDEQRLMKAICEADPGKGIIPDNKQDLDTLRAMLRDGLVWAPTYSGEKQNYVATDMGRAILEEEEYFDTLAARLHERLGGGSWDELTEEQKDQYRSSVDALMGQAQDNEFRKVRDSLERRGIKPGDNP